MYPLAFTRTLNSRYVAGLQSEFGSAGNWRHSFQWSIDSNTAGAQSQYPADYWVNYPDGRRVQFKPAPSPGPNSADPYFRGPPGIRDRFQQLKSASGFSTTECYLRLPDGGKIKFAATLSNGRFNYQLKEIIDPYGQKLTISYPPDLSMTIQEPAGRQLKIFYTPDLNPQANRSPVVTRVERWSSPGGTRVQAIYYGYSAYIGSTALTSVRYTDDGTTATYTYQRGNVTGEAARPLIHTCIDPMFMGPMWKIGYTFVDHGLVYGQLESENYFDGSDIGQAVSTLTVPGKTIRVETRGDGPSRTFTYFPTPYWQPAYALRNVTDFKGVTTSFSYDNAGFLSSVTDGRGNITFYQNNPRTGNTNITFHACTPSDDDCNPQSTSGTVYLGEPQSSGFTADDAINPYHTYRTTNGPMGRGKRGANATYVRDSNTKRVTTIYYPIASQEPERETFTYASQSQFGQMLTHRMTTDGEEKFKYDGRGLLKEYSDPYHRNSDAPEEPEVAPTPWPTPSLRYE
jgi:YD repeat-containing protein